MSDPAALSTLTYVSTTTELMSAAELVDMLEEIRPRNRDHGLTGMLLYSGGNVIQVLEGPVAEVDGVFAAIERDPRHRDVTVLQRTGVAQRAFGDWAMGFRHLSEREVRDVMTLTEFVRRPAGEGLGEHAEHTYELLTLFRAHA